jgi:tRNA(fMet)-specific endonuclease VapC
MKEILLDTDVLSEFLRGNPKVTEHINRYLQNFNCLNISIITYYEILNGLLYKDARKQLNKFEDFVKLNKVLPLTLKTVHFSAEIQAELRTKGNEIGHTDVLIAGIAFVNDLTLITNNQAHFSRISKLRTENWTI